MDPDSRLTTAVPAAAELVKGEAAAQSEVLEKLKRQAKKPGGEQESPRLGEGQWAAALSFFEVVVCQRILSDDHMQAVEQGKRAGTTKQRKSWETR